LSTGPFEPFAALKPQDPVAVIAPASGFDRPSFEQGLAVLAGRYRPEYEPGIFTKQRYLAGDDARRLAELTRALGDPRIRGVFCARGGYGATRLLAQLRALAPPADAKPLVGFSDITALHLWLGAHHRMSVHGPVLTQLGRLPQATHARLFSLLESAQPAGQLQATDTYVPGVAEGRLVGGNLSVLSRMLGTPWMPELEDTILLLEDFGERPYRLDRMWTHLELAGVFARVRGIVLGTFTQCEEKEAPYTSSDVLRELVRATGLPCAAGFPIGHGAENEPLALGVKVRLDAGARRLTFLQAAAA
jgi:muramoyltetrapeptide carboxypeptidase